MSHMVQLAVFVRGTDVKFSATDESAALISMQGTTTPAGLHTTGQERTAKSDVSVDKMPGLVTDGALIVAGKEWWRVSACHQRIAI
jgi:hypothetical protein